MRLCSLLLALRYPGAVDDEARRGIALTSTALLFYVAFVSMGGVNNNGPGSFMWGSGVTPAFGVANLATVFAITGAWLWATRGAGSKNARNIAWLTLAFALAGLLTFVFEVRMGQVGFARFLMVLMLTYAILRHQLLGIDVKLRWTISKSTIAAVFIAVFIAVFFVASEAAQQFFGDTLGSTYVGIAAAGALVFAIAPLAVFGTAKEESYKRALRLALRDRALSREEDIHLHELAAHLGIGAGRGMTLRVEVEREMEGNSA